MRSITASTAERPVEQAPRCAGSKPGRSGAVIAFARRTTRPSPPPPTGKALRRRTRRCAARRPRCSRRGRRRGLQRGQRAPWCGGGGRARGGARRASRAAQARREALQLAAQQVVAQRARGSPPPCGAPRRAGRGPARASPRRCRGRCPRPRRSPRSRGRRSSAGTRRGDAAVAAPGAPRRGPGCAPARRPRFGDLVDGGLAGALRADREPQGDAPHPALERALGAEVALLDKGAGEGLLHDVVRRLGVVRHRREGPWNARWRSRYRSSSSRSSVPTTLKDPSRGRNL